MQTRARVCVRGLPVPFGASRVALPNRRAGGPHACARSGGRGPRRAWSLRADRRPRAGPRAHVPRGAECARPVGARRPHQSGGRGAMGPCGRRAAPVVLHEPVPLPHVAASAGARIGALVGAGPAVVEGLDTALDS